MEKDNFSTETNKKIRIFLGITGKISSTLVILFLSINVLGQIFFPEQLMDIVGFRVFTISDTGSMFPELQHHDLVVIRRFDFDLLEVGDFVTFESRQRFRGEEQNIFVTHKIIEVLIDSETSTRTYRTSGIHPNVGPDQRLMTADGFNDTNRFLGKYMFHIGRPQDIREFLTSTPGIIAITVNFICLVAIGVLLIYDEETSD